jgi:hypothetical protein
MSVETPVRRRRVDPLSPRSFLVWFGLFGPVVAWGANLVLGDLIFELGCGPATRGRLFGMSVSVWAAIQTAVALAIALAAGACAVAAWRRIRRISNGTRWERAHALTLGAMASSGLFALLIAWSFLTPVILPACGSSP